MQEGSYDEAFLKYLSMQSIRGGGEIPTSPDCFSSPPQFTEGHNLDAFQLDYSDAINIGDFGDMNGLNLKNPPSPQTAAFTFTDIQQDDAKFMQNFGEHEQPVSIPYAGAHAKNAAHTPFGAVRIVIQPHEYQVVNYNIFPAPEIEFSQVNETSINVAAFLVYGDDRGAGSLVKINNGFTNGDIQF